MLTAGQRHVLCIFLLACFSLVAYPVGLLLARAFRLRALDFQAFFLYHIVPDMLVSHGIATVSADSVEQLHL